MTKRIALTVLALALASIRTDAEVTGRLFRVTVVSSFGTTFTDCSAPDLARTLRRAEAAHRKHERSTGHVAGVSSFRGELMAENGSTQTVKNVVLVHGAFADGSSWSKVI